MHTLTVIIPTRNRHALLREAIHSCLADLPSGVEVMVSDNASTDATPTVAKEFPGIRYVRRTELLPMADHWNRCVAECSSPFVKVLCDDDWVLPGALKRELSLLKADPSLAAVASARWETNPQREKLALKGPSRDFILRGEPLFARMLVEENILGPPSAVMFRREKFRGFPASYDYAADWAAWILLTERGDPVQFLAEPGCGFRLHDSNLTNRYVEEGTDFVEVMALRRECLRRMPGAMPMAGWLYYAGIFSYRVLRRVARLVLRGENPWNFLKRAFREGRKPL
jgi:glycosyltransferase involved in cell wall biosynthesis